MNKSQKISLLILRLSLGWLMLYAGVAKILNPAWSAAGYLTNAKTLSGFYQLLAQPGILPIVNFLNAWGLTILGISLILGIGVRLSSILGAVLMVLYYFPANNFPFVANGFLVDDHIIYALVLTFFAAIRAGRYYGLENWCANLPWCSRHPGFQKVFG